MLLLLTTIIIALVTTHHHPSAMYTRDGVVTSEPLRRGVQFITTVPDAVFSNQQQLLHDTHHHR